MRRSPNRELRAGSPPPDASNPNAAAGDLAEVTGTIAHLSDPGSESGPFNPPVRVRVTRLRSGSTELLTEIGPGILIDRLAVGEHFRVVIDGRPTLTTSAVQRLEHSDDRAVEVETANSVYHLELECAGGEEEWRKGVTCTVQRLNKLVLRARIGSTRPSGGVSPEEESAPGDQQPTRSVSLASAPRPGAGIFHSGVTIRVTRIRGADHLSDDRRDLGSALLLDDLTMGEPARFSLQSGPTVVTSPVRGLEKLGARAVQLVTRNSTYRFELISPSD